MELSIEQVAGMAPDAASAAAGKKLMAAKNWQELGRSPAAVWGLCQGSAVYQVRVDLSNLGYACSCPSRKFPCKHVLGLLMLAASSPQALGESEPPDWVAQWLEKRQATAARKAERQTAEQPDEKAQARRAEQRAGRVSDGLQRLDVWLGDLVRNGLAGLEGQPGRLWEDQAKRLVDAQAPGLASRVGRIAAIPGSSRDWPGRLLGELGRLKLVVEAYRRLDQLDPPLQADLRQLIGWNVSQEQLERDGEPVDDEWFLYGQWIDDEDRVRAQRTWAVGRRTGRTALLLQFAPGSVPFAEQVVPGTRQEATLVFYAGAAGQRAKFGRSGNVAAIEERVPGQASIPALLGSVAAQLARQPWQNATGCVLHDVTLVVRDELWMVRDQTGCGLPLAGRHHWLMLALSGGRPFDITGEWDGWRLRPLGMFLDGRFRPLGG